MFSPTSPTASRTAVLCAIVADPLSPGREQGTMLTPLRTVDVRATQRVADLLGLFGPWGGPPPILIVKYSRENTEQQFISTRQ